MNRIDHHSITPTLRYSVLVVLCALLLALPGPAYTQQPVSDGEQPALATRVQLLIGPTTAAKAAAALSEQTGLKIEVADYLADRRVTMLLEGVTARQALDAMAALNAWTWRKTAARRYLLARPALRVPRRPSEMGAALKASLPRDFRVLLGIEPAKVAGADKIDLARVSGIPATDRLRERSKERLAELLIPLV